MARLEDFSDEQIDSLAEHLKTLITDEEMKELSPEERAFEGAVLKIEDLTRGLNIRVATLVERLRTSPLNCADASVACANRVTELRSFAQEHQGVADWLDVPALKRAEALVAFSDRLTRRRLQDLTARAATITPESDLDGAIALLALGQRGTPQFWDLARNVRDRMDEIGEKGERRSLLYALIPRHALYRRGDGKPSYGLAGGRASSVEWVRPAGLPGQGRRA